MQSVNFQADGSVMNTSFKCRCVEMAKSTCRPFFVASSLGAKPIKVFVLAGDGSVLENGMIEPGKKAKSPAGTLVDAVANNPEYVFLKSSDGEWTFRNDGKVTEEVAQALTDRQNPTQPLPRVLFIGDSITGTYWKQVQKNLDGKAVVFKNPGNAEDTWNGLDRIDEWLDLKRYLLNGQEYLELVDGVKKVMGDEAERLRAWSNKSGASIL